MCGRYAESLSAVCAVEMDMPVFQQTTVRIGTGFVLERATSVFERVDQMMLLEQVQGSEKSGFIDGVQLNFQIGERQRILIRQKNFEYKLTDRRGFNTLLS